MTAYYNRFFTTQEFYHIVVEAVESMKDFKYALNEKIIDDVLKEKIMLAVTAINGCELCDTFHTKEAEKLGIDWKKESGLVIGRVGIATTTEDLAIDFAKDYTNNQRRINQKKWDQLVARFGIQGAKGVLGAVRIITLGNASGIAFGALMSRLRFKPVKGSRLINELSVTLSIIVFLPLAFIKRFLKAKIDLKVDSSNEQ